MKTIAEINEKIRLGQAVVVDADEMVEIVREDGPAKAADRVDVVTTGTFGPMCSTGAFFNIGHTKPKIKIRKAWLNNVPVYCGLAAVDFFLGGRPRGHEPGGPVQCAQRLPELQRRG